MRNIKVYSSPTCGYCNQLKDWLKEKGVEFEEFNVFENEEARDFIVKKSGQMGVPVSLIADENGENEEVVLGFDPDKIGQLLGL